ncbi:hypothetical protein [Frigidibacter sp. ROC022]|uniref:hypothetical protein n=1 Tax=Frigidibacter sp. ROC022 TaxID=2971796 RepID=UPI00215B3391|nr:hypothetical protein [Frigidibacter sp. ROC022]MCR8724073.1 hypothetical protein [Frigidibacter sp. ROC022]
MLSPEEFTVGDVGTARPLSLLLPISKYDEAMLIGELEGVAVAVLLSGDQKSCLIECEGNDSWKGLIVPDVRVEVDESSLVDVNVYNPPSLAVVRTGTRLAIRATREKWIQSRQLVTLHEGLVPAGELQATFARWQVVVGVGDTRRVLWSRREDEDS